MDVVAKHKGKYGRMRVRGDEFTLTDKKHFSERWMVKAGSKDAKAILAETRADGMTAAQIAAEEAAATGRTSNKAELAAKDERIAELEEEVRQLRADLEAANAGGDDAGGDDAGGDDAGGDDAGGDDAGGDDAGGDDAGGDDAGGDDAPAERPTRRTRRSR